MAVLCGTMRQRAQAHRVTMVGVAAVAAAILAALVFLASAEGFLAPRHSPRSGAAAAATVGVSTGRRLRSSLSFSAEEASAPESSSLQGAARFLLVAGAAVALAKGASLVIRRAVPKHKTAPWKTRKQRIAWCKKGERKAQEALQLGLSIKRGTADFIYGRPQDEEDYEDDYEDDEFEDEDDDELEKKKLA